MLEVELGGTKYRTGRLDAFQQFHIFRKLMPVISGLGESFAQMDGTSRPTPTPTPNGEDEAPVPVAPPTSETAFWAALEPMAKAISEMSKDDSEYVLKTCLSTCTLNNGSQWVRVMSASGQIMFEDRIDMMVMLRLTFETIKDNLSGFFSGPRPNGSLPEGFPAQLFS